jgi:hypothetical protein
MTGRPSITLTEHQRAEVETLAAVLTAAQIADFLGIGRTTFFALIERDAELSERYKRGKARAIGAVAQSLVTKARAGNVTAMIFFLKTQGGWRETVEVDNRTTVVDGTTSGDSFARLAVYLDQVAARSGSRLVNPASSRAEEVDHA